MKTVSEIKSHMLALKKEARGLPEDSSELKKSLELVVIALEWVLGPSDRHKDRKSELVG